MCLALLLILGTDRLGAAGESCMRTNDCQEPLRCIANTCAMPPPAPETKHATDIDIIHVQQIDEKHMPKAGWHVEYHRNKPLWTGGLGLFLSAAVITGVAGVATCKSETCLGLELTPVVGPLIYGVMVAGSAPVVAVLGFASTLVQVTGLILFGHGLSKRAFIVRDGTTISLLPAVTNGGATIAVIGSY